VSERYRKWGRTIRFERDTIIEATEAGEAIEDGERFEARPSRDAIDIPPIEEDVASFLRAIHVDVNVERLIVTVGVTEHEFEGVRWRDASARLHISMNNGRLRSKLDLGGSSLKDIPLDDVHLVARALARAGGRRDTPERCVVAPHVSALLLPGMGLKLVQTARGRDGKGAEVEELVLDHPPFPNWFRPSYRVRPIRMPFHFRTEEFGTMEGDVPRVVALLRVGETSDVLCDDGQSVFETTIRIDRVKAAGPPLAWYPHLAGAFGHEVLL